jgi:hypothetical protein
VVLGEIFILHLWSSFIKDLTTAKHVSDICGRHSWIVDCRKDTKATFQDLHLADADYVLTEMGQNNS